MAKRALSLFLALAAVFSLAAPAFAAEGAAEATEEPVMTEEPAAEVTEVPAEVTEAPVEVPAEPAVTEVPVEEQELSVDVLDVSVEEPDVSVEDTEVPIVTEGPVEATEGPVVTEEPVMPEGPAVTEEPETTEAPKPAEEAEDEPMTATEKSGTCGEGLTYTLTDDGTLIISGNGAMEAHTYSGGVPWNYLRDKIKKAVIQSGVTNIGGYAFDGCTSLASVIIPESVTSIGPWAFCDCASLTDVTIPNSVTCIEIGAFAGSGLTSVSIPESVTSIGWQAFSFCASLSSIKGYAFSEAHKFATNNGYQFVPFNPERTVSGKCGNQTWTITGSGQFTLTGTGEMWNDPPWEEYDYAITEVVIGGGITSISGGAFSGCPLTSVTIQEGVTTIEKSAFSGCTSLTSVTILGGVTSIGSSAFQGCTSLTSMTIPGSVTSIGSSAFQGCTSLTSMTIPGSVHKIDWYTFLGCISLTSVTIQEGVTTIEKSAFYGCTSLASVTIPASVTGIGDVTANQASPTNITCPDDTVVVNMGTFSGCTSLASVTILNPVCLIYEHQSTLGIYGGATTVYGYDDSTAQKYADKYGYPFISLGVAPRPATPKLSKVENTVGGVKISWKAVEGATKYRVYYKTTGGWKKLADTDKTSYTWTKAKSGTKYAFTVRVYGDSGESDYDKTGKSLTYIAAPKVKVANTADGIKVSWGKCAGAAKYRVFYKTSANGKWTRIGDTAATSYTRKNAKLTSGKTYYFTVRCVSANGKSFTSAYDTAGKSVKFVKAPTVKAAKAASGIKISWDKIAGANKYQVFYKTGSGAWKKLTVTAKTDYTWTKAKSGTKYSFTVRCMNAKGAYVSAYNTKGVSITYKK